MAESNTGPITIQRDYDTVRTVRWPNGRPIEAGDLTEGALVTVDMNTGTAEIHQQWSKAELEAWEAKNALPFQLRLLPPLVGPSDDLKTGKLTMGRILHRGKVK